MQNQHVGHIITISIINHHVIMKLPSLCYHRPLLTYFHPIAKREKYNGLEKLQALSLPQVFISEILFSQSGQNEPDIVSYFFSLLSDQKDIWLN